MKYSILPLLLCMACGGGNSDMSMTNPVPDAGNDALTTSNNGGFNVPAQCTPLLGSNAGKSPCTATYGTGPTPPSGNQCPQTMVSPFINTVEHVIAYCVTQVGSNCELNVFYTIDQINTGCADIFNQFKNDLRIKCTCVNNLN